MGRKNAVVRVFRRLARKFRAFEEQHLMRLYPGAGRVGRLGRVPLWLLDALVLGVKLCTTCAVAAVGVVLPPAMKSLHGETVLVTGAGQGIGRELALQLAELGATVLCWDRNSSSNDATVLQIRAKDGEGFGYTVDVSAREQVAAAAARAQRQFPDVSMVVSNAGALVAAPLCQLPPDSILRTVEVNLLAHFWLIQAFLPSMIERRHGHIVAINSSAGLMPFSDMAPYCAAKFGLRGLMESLTEELRLDTWTKNICTTSVYLASVSTGLYAAPSHRFTGYYSEISAKDAAAAIIDGVRRNHRSISVPSLMSTLVHLNNLMPYRIRIIFTDFFNFPHRGWFCFC